MAVKLWLILQQTSVSKLLLCHLVVILGFTLSLRRVAFGLPLNEDAPY